MSEQEIKKTIRLKINSDCIEGDLSIPENPKGLIIFAHGSGSSRFSPRNSHVAQLLHKNDLATFLVDLLTKHEDQNYESRFNIDLLAERLITITNWLREDDDVKHLKMAYFGASTGAAATVKAAVKQKGGISAIVSRGGRVDMAVKELDELQTPILLIVGENDDFVVESNADALKKINCPKKLSIIPRATHLFEEPGSLEEVAREASKWFLQFFK